MKSLTNYQIRVQAAIIVLFTLIILFSALSGNAQSIKMDSQGNYIAVKAASDSSNYKATGRTYTDTKGQTFDVFISKSGKLFINRISRNTNKAYRQYLKID